MCVCERNDGKMKLFSFISLKMREYALCLQVCFPTCGRNFYVSFSICNYGIEIDSYVRLGIYLMNKNVESEQTSFGIRCGEQNKREHE